VGGGEASDVEDDVGASGSESESESESDYKSEVGGDLSTGILYAL
jgi:hypothetical protein